MMHREDKMYQQEFGHIPDDQLGRVTLILGKQAENAKYNAGVTAAAKQIKSVKWEKIKFTMWKVLKPSARPRLRRRGKYTRVYVPRARAEGDYFEEYAREHNLPKIETPCILNIVIYEKTPDSWSIKNRVLAELGFIRPWKRTGDFDNFAKSVSDFIQHGMLKDDCLVIESTQKLYYSIKPHAEIEIKYMKEWPTY